eukprot:15351661-Ditylum_brightwellii.AAC.2
MEESLVVSAGIVSAADVIFPCDIEGSIACALIGCAKSPSIPSGGGWQRKSISPSIILPLLGVIWS